MPNRGNPLAFYLRLGAAVLAALLLAAGELRAVLHVNDLAGSMTHVSGIWMALAQYLNDGIFYPPLYADGYYAGTRYMPVFFSLIAGTEHLTGNYLVAAKAVTLLAMAGLVTATVAAAWRTTRRPLDAVALGGLVLAFPEGLRALLMPYADALAVAFAVAGLLAIGTTPTRLGRILIAAALFGLAIGTKYSSVAAPAAAVVFLLQRDRKSGLILLGLGVLLAGAGFGGLQLASGGRFLENFRALGGLTASTLPNGPARFAGALIVSSKITFVAPLILPLALLTVFQNFRARGLTLWDWYFLAALATTLVIYSSPGTDLNHLIEIEIASVLVVAQRFSVEVSAARPTADAPVARGLIFAALLVAWYCLVTNVEPDELLPFAVLKDELPPNPHLLAEDPMPVVLLGQRPVVMDAFAFRLLAERGLIDDTELVERIRRQEFNGLVLLRRLDDKETTLNEQHFGPRVTEALRGAYEFDKQVGQYYLYQPTKKKGFGRRDEG